MTEDPHPGANAEHGHTVVIVGAGFSGAATAIQLLRLAKAGLRVVLINESGRMARGLAYGTHSNAHVLNVPAGNMSALAGDPDDFLRYCRWSDPQVDAHSFVSRRLYGAYLEALLSAAELFGTAGAQLDRVVGRVIEILPGTSQAQVRLQDGRVFLADDVVLAFGHFAPRDPLSARDVAVAGPRYVCDPWRPGALSAIRPDDDVLLVGAGLTAVDVALALNRTSRTGRLLVISRRGLVPQAHRSSGVVPGVVDGAALAAAMGDTVRSYLRVLRAEVVRHRTRGEDWRDVIGALRPYTARLWQRLTLDDRKRFLRHLRPHWEVVRHRCAPAAHDVLAALMASGHCMLMAARVQGVTSIDGGLEVDLQPRGSGAPQRRQLQAIVNCTGPTSDVRHSGSPLIEHLLDAGLICPDSLGLGLRVGERYRTIDGEGRESPWLHYIGPLLKASEWEATAVPELRVHALRLAEQLLHVDRSAG